MLLFLPDACFSFPQGAQGRNPKHSLHHFAVCPTDLITTFFICIMNSLSLSFQGAIGFDELDGVGMVGPTRQMGQLRS